MSRAKLQTDFYKETGIECVNNQGEFDVGYVSWLEDKIISNYHRVAFPNKKCGCKRQTKDSNVELCEKCFPTNMA